ncbi:MAG: hypothetical protein M0Q90_14195 [Bacteroidales bacterium]|nr:hypothetical protein [Bacteroidales bacterium]
MKVKIEYYIPKITVKGEVEVGDITNNELVVEQAKIIDDYIVNNLRKQLSKKTETIHTKTKLSI